MNRLPRSIRHLACLLTGSAALALVADAARPAPPNKPARLVGELGVLHEAGDQLVLRMNGQHYLLTYEAERGLRDFGPVNFRGRIYAQRIDQDLLSSLRQARAAGGPGPRAERAANRSTERAAERPLERPGLVSREAASSSPRR